MNRVVPGGISQLDENARLTDCGGIWIALAPRVREMEVSEVVSNGGARHYGGGPPGMA